MVVAAGERRIEGERMEVGEDGGEEEYGGRGK